MKLILNGNLEFEVAHKPKLSGDPIQIPLVDASSLPEVITGEVILQDMIVWPTQETVAPPPPVGPVVAEGEEAYVQEASQPEVFVLYKTIAEDWLRHYVNGNTLCFTNNPVPAEPTPEEIKAQREAEVRANRDARIAETDWTQVLDAPITTPCREAFRVYRQALRDVPQQAGFPEEVIWPEKPEVVKATPDPVDTALEILVGGDE